MFGEISWRKFRGCLLGRVDDVVSFKIEKGINIVKPELTAKITPYGLNKASFFVENVSVAKYHCEGMARVYVKARDIKKQTEKLYGTKKV